MTERVPGLVKVHLAECLNSLALVAPILVQNLAAATDADAAPLPKHPIGWRLVVVAIRLQQVQRVEGVCASHEVGGAQHLAVNARLLHENVRLLQQLLAHVRVNRHAVLFHEARRRLLESSLAPRLAPQKVRGHVLPTAFCRGAVDDKLLGDAWNGALLRCLDFRTFALGGLRGGYHATHRLGDRVDGLSALVTDQLGQLCCGHALCLLNEDHEPQKRRLRRI
mmetsp:Transcript_57272/g.159406  ORF Transcript_57272/g.159406 Transcript_57272/m.159406 type:complete len:223 (+) Transcript_57272:1174-1842(+)